MAPRRALARRTQRLFGYWRSETRTIRQGLVALTLSTLASFVAGLTLASITGTLSSLPGLLVLIPAAVGMRGTIFGAIGAAGGLGVSSTWSAGTIRPRRSDHTMSRVEGCRRPWSSRSAPRRGIPPTRSTAASSTTSFPLRRSRPEVRAARHRERQPRRCCDDPAFLDRRRGVVVTRGTNVTFPSTT